MDPFVQQLADLCRAHVTRNKWVFVPTHALGRTLGERIALDGTDWLNLRFVTPLDIALRMGAPFLVERGIDPSEEGLGAALIMRLLLDLPVASLPRHSAPARRRGYFRPLADQPTLAQALWTTIRELRMAGVKSTDLKAGAFESAAKHAELCALLGAYEQFLVANNRGDMAAVYEEALEHREWCPIQPQDCWTELPEHIWTPLQRRLMDAMPGERIAPHALAVPGAAIPRRSGTGGVGSVRLQADPAISGVRTGSVRLQADPAISGDRTSSVRLQADPAISDVHTGSVRLQADPAINPLAFLMTPAPNAVDSLDLFHAGGRDAEIEEVFRRILATCAPLDQIEIACASEAPVALIWEKALRHDWAVTLGPGIPATQTRPGRALIGLCDWVETDFSAAHFRRLLQSGDMGIEMEDEGFTAGQAARILGRAGAGWGRATYELALGRLRKAYASRAADPDESDDDRAYSQGRADLTKKILDWTAGLIASIPEPGAEGKVPLQAVVEGAIQFIEHSTARKSVLDHRAAAGLIDYVAELRALGQFSCTLVGALRFIRERVQALSVAPERPRPGHLYVSTLAQAGYSGRPHLFVVGLEEGRVFPSATEDAVLLDAERAGISPELRVSADKIDEAVYGVLSRIATWSATQAVNSQLPTPNSQAPTPNSQLEAGAAQKDSLGVDKRRGVHPAITFSYSTRDTREFRETYASWLMLQAFRLQQGDAAASYQQMKAALGEPKSVVSPDRLAASSPSGWWLRTVAGTADQGVAAVSETFPALARGRTAGARKASDDFTEFDGHVPEAGSVLDPCADGAALSVTVLQDAAGCPFRFFLKRGLGIRPVDERERDKDVWLDPLTRGSELHEVYASLLRRCRDEGRRPDNKKDRAWLNALAHARLAELQREMPAATSEILDRETKEFIADVELFLEAEVAATEGMPVGFEVSFGRPLDDDLEPLARPEPVEIDLGKGLTFRIAGRIDRIDQVGPSSFEVLDYKSGTFWPDSWKGVFAGGRRLQHALYGLATVELLRSRYKNPKVVAGVYYFPSRKGRRERVRIPAPGEKAIAAVLADLREVILNGSFVHSATAEDCKFCDYSAACDQSIEKRAEGKLADQKLKAYVRLSEHV